MSALFVCATVSKSPSQNAVVELGFERDSHSLPSFRGTGENGDPVATKALPSVQAKASSGSTSHKAVGLDMGNW